MANKTETITIRVSPWEKEMISELAWLERSSVSKLIVKLAWSERLRIKNQGIEVDMIRMDDRMQAREDEEAKKLKEAEKAWQDIHSAK